MGLLYAAPAMGALMASLTSRWTARVHRHGLAVMLAATVWGIAIVGFGFAGGLAPALLCLACAGGADCVSGVKCARVKRNVAVVGLAVGSTSALRASVYVRFTEGDVACDQIDVALFSQGFVGNDADVVMTPTADVWMEDGIEPLPVEITGWPPAVAEAKYAARLLELCPQW